VTVGHLPRAPQLVGVRIPDDTFMRRLCQMCAEPLALTSANISSHTSTVTVEVSEKYYLTNSGAFIRLAFTVLK